MTKIYFVESVNLFRDWEIIDGTGFFDEQQAKALATEEHALYSRNFFYSIKDLKIKYSHRNGETEDPTEDGWYWVEQEGLFWMQQNPASELVGTLRFWGPIPMPEGE